MTEHHYALRGEVDLAAEEQVREDLARLIRLDGAHLVIDCTYLTFIDSTGICVLLDAHLELETRGRHLLVVNLPPDARRAFEILGVADLLTYDRRSADRTGVPGSD